MPRTIVYGTPHANKGLGRRVPDDFKHLSKFPARLVLPRTVAVVETQLALPWWHLTHDQGREGACVGFGTTMMAAILNSNQRKAAGIKPNTVRYDPWWLWDRAKEIDYWAETNPGDSEGTSVNAACEILRTKGLVQYKYTRKLLPRLGFNADPQPEHGIEAYRWAQSVDEMRSALAEGKPISIGVNWYSNFYTPVKHKNEWWIGRGPLGRIEGGHCVCVTGASDRRQAFKIKNSWGASYPTSWMPYDTMRQLLAEDGEAALITDR